MAYLAPPPHTIKEYFTPILLGLIGSVEFGLVKNDLHRKEERKALVRHERHTLLSVTTFGNNISALESCVLDFLRVFFFFFTSLLLHRAFLFGLIHRMGNFGILFIIFFIFLLFKIFSFNEAKKYYLYKLFCN